jgi:hypothetical protein
MEDLPQQFVSMAARQCVALGAALDCTVADLFRLNRTAIIRAVVRVLPMGRCAGTYEHFIFPFVVHQNTLSKTANA